MSLVIYASGDVGNTPHTYIHMTWCLDEEAIVELDKGVFAIVVFGFPELALLIVMKLFFLAIYLIN